MKHRPWACKPTNNHPILHNKREDSIMNQLQKRRNRKGFTLIELIVVIAILAILAAIAIPAFSKQLSNAKIRTHEANIKVLVSAAQVALASNGEASNVEWPATVMGDWASQDYVAEWPTDPFFPDEATGGYAVTINGNSLTVTYTLPNGKTAPTGARTGTVFPAP